MSDAVSAQGTTFEIQDSTAGGVKNITAISKANPGVFSIAAHGLKIGDVVDLAAIGGMVELNGRTGIVAKAAFAAGALSLVDSITGKPIDTTNYTAYTNGGTATPKTFLATKEHKSYAFNPTARPEIAKTTMVSTAVEKLLGLKDFGNFTVAMNIVRSEPAQLRMKGALDIQGIWFRCTDPLGNVILFTGMVKSFGESASVGEVANGSLEISMSGEKIEVLV